MKFFYSYYFDAGYWYLLVNGRLLYEGREWQKIKHWLKKNRRYDLPFGDERAAIATRFDPRPMREALRVCDEVNPLTSP